MVAMCCKCGDQPRLPGSRSTWCRECKREWQRNYRRGVVLLRPVPPPIRDANGCLLWQGCVDKEGYARATRNGKPDYLHRHVWRDLHGPIPDGMTIDHTCEVKICMEPTHLDVCSRPDNVKRFYERRRA